VTKKYSFSDFGTILTGLSAECPKAYTNCTWGEIPKSETEESDIRNLLEIGIIAKCKILEGWPNFPERKARLIRRFWSLKHKGRGKNYHVHLFQSDICPNKAELENNLQIKST